MKFFKINITKLVMKANLVFILRLFHAKKNRVELIADFPEGDEAKTISSLRLVLKG